MPFPQDQIVWLAANRQRVARYMFIPQLLVALLFMGFAYRTGSAHARLLLRGAQTQGRIVSFRSVRMSSRSGSHLSDTDTIHLPFIEFQANDHVIRFEEWKAANSDPGIGAFVPVLYDPSNPSFAMMDRGPMNWVPWAPCAAIALLLTLVALKGLFVFLLSSLRSPAAVSS